MNVLDRFPPLQGAIAHAESWKTYLNACQEELGSQPAQDIIARAENNVGIGIQLGELLPITWSALFNAIFRPSLASWNSVKEFEAFRQQVRALFYTGRECECGVPNSPGFARPSADDPLETSRYASRGCSSPPQRRVAAFPDNFSAALGGKTLQVSHAGGIVFQ